MVLILGLAGCGGGGASDPQNLPDALGYVPPDAHLVMLVPTDLQGDQWRRFGRLVAPELKNSDFPTVRDNIRASIPDVNFDHELAPLLGDTLVIATFGLPKSPRVLASVQLAPLGKPAADWHTSGDVVEGDVTVPVPDGLD